MILEQRERNAAKTALRYARSTTTNDTKMRSTPLNVSREHVQELLATTAGMERKSKQPTLTPYKQHDASHERKLNVANAMASGKHGILSGYGHDVHVCVRITGVGVCISSTNTIRVLDVLGNDIVSI